MLKSDIDISSNELYYTVFEENTAIEKYLDLLSDKDK
jgi:hypothetical protein